MVFEHRGGGLFDLQEQGIVLVAALQEDDKRARADATDTDHLARNVDYSESLKQRATVGLEGRSIRAKLLMDDVLELFFGHSD